jgi:NAD(P)-dependent dehydrogenase (short-subunit alcohol dehydrogenase family)
MVERFVEEGASVFFSGRRAELGSEVAQLIGATFIEAGAAAEADAARTIAAATAGGGRIDVLVNNAGGTTGSARPETVALEDFDNTFAVHVRGAMAHMKHVAARMRAQQQGGITNIGSIAGHRAGYAGTLGYSAAKAALIHPSRCTALELGEDRVRVSDESSFVNGTDIVVDGGAIGGRRFSDVVAGRQATRAVLE